MSDDRDYFWVVLCKNHRYHHKGNTSYAHQIALGETDAYSPLPMVTQRVAVRCDVCGEEYSYKPAEILRNVIEIPLGFVPHPLFQPASVEAASVGTRSPDSSTHGAMQSHGEGESN